MRLLDACIERVGMKKSGKSLLGGGPALN